MSTHGTTPAPEPAKDENNNKNTIFIYQYSAMDRADPSCMQYASYMCGIPSS